MLTASRSLDREQRPEKTLSFYIYVSAEAWMLNLGDWTVPGVREIPRFMYFFQVLLFIWLVSRQLSQRSLPADPEGWAEVILQHYEECDLFLTDTTLPGEAGSLRVRQSNGSAVTREPSTSITDLPSARKAAVLAAAWHQKPCRAVLGKFWC